MRSKSLKSAIDDGFIPPATFAALFAQAFQLTLDRNHVVEQKFAIHDGNIPGRVDTAGRVRHAGVFKAAYHVHKAVHLGQLVEQLAGDASLGRAAFQPGDIGVGHLGVNLLLRLEHLGQAVDARIGHVHHRRVDFKTPAAHRDRLITTRESVEDGRFSRLRQSNNSQAHGTILPHLDLATNIRYTIAAV